MRKSILFSLSLATLFAQSTSSILDSAESESSLDLPVISKEASANSISLKNLIDEVVASNPKITAAINTLEIAHKDKDIADNVFLPTLDLNASAGWSSTKAKVHGYSIKPDAKGTAIAASLVLNENLYNGGRDVAIKNQQNDLSIASGYNLIQQANDLAYEVARAYLEFIRASLKYDIAKKNLESHEEIYSLIKDRTSSGFARASEERQAGSRLALARTNLLSAENDYKDAKQSLMKYYGKNIDSNSLIMPSVDASMPASVDELNEESFKCNPSLMVKRFNESAAAHGIKVAKGAFLPRVDAQLSAGYQNDKTQKDAFKDSQATKLEAKLLFSYNLFNKNADKLAVEKAKLAHVSSGALGEDLKRDLEESNTFAMDSYEITKQKIAYLKDYVKYAKETLLTYQDEFKLGKRELLNLLDAQSEYFSSARESVDADNKFLMAQFKILQNKGVLLDYFINGFNTTYVANSCNFKQ